MIEDAPRRAWRLKLSLHADTREDLVHALVELGERALVGEVLTEAGAIGAAGGTTSGFAYTLNVTPEMTGDRYRQELLAYVDAKPATTRETGK